MTARLDDPLEAAQLTAQERRVVERILAILRERVEGDLLAIWLYGSRARGEADLTETHHDLRSDVDLMAIVASSRDANGVRWDVQPLLEKAADA